MGIGEGHPRASRRRRGRSCPSRLKLASEKGQLRSLSCCGPGLAGPERFPRCWATEQEMKGHRARPLMLTEASGLILGV